MEILPSSSPRIEQHRQLEAALRRRSIEGNQPVNNTMANGVNPDYQMGMCVRPTHRECVRTSREYCNASKIFSFTLNHLNPNGYPACISSSSEHSYQYISILDRFQVRPSQDRH